MKKSSKIMAAVFSAAAIAAAAGIVYLNIRGDDAKYACIYDDGTLLHKININEVTKPYTIEVGGNTILVEKGQISMLDADCPDGLCIKEGAISNGARPIICLPNKIVIKLTDDESDVDFTTGA